MKRGPVETWWHLLPVAGMEYGDPRKKWGMPGLIKCVSFQDELQGGIFYICNSLLDYLVGLVEMGRSTWNLKPLLFSAGWLRLQTHHCSRGENWDVSGQVKGISNQRAAWIRAAPLALWKSGADHCYQNQVVFVLLTTEKKQHLPSSEEQFLWLWSLEHLSARLEII